MRSIHIRVYSTCNFYFNSYRCRFLYVYFHMLSNQWDQVHHNSLFYYKMYNVQQNSFYKYMYYKHTCIIILGVFFLKKKVRLKKTQPGLKTQYDALFFSDYISRIQSQCYIAVFLPLYMQPQPPTRKRGYFIVATTPADVVNLVIKWRNYNVQPAFRKRKSPTQPFSRDGWVGV